MNFRPIAIKTCLLACLLNAANATAQDAHTGHGELLSASEQELFSRSPFRRARLIPGLREVTIPITTTNPVAQEFFDQGHAFLLAGWPQEAERSFATAHLADKPALLPRWGLAMTHLVRDQLDAVPWITGIQARESAFARHAPVEQMLLRALPPVSLLDTDDPAASRQFVVDSLRRAMVANPAANEPRALLACLLSDAWHPRLEELGESRDGTLGLIRTVLEKSPAHPAGRLGLRLWANELRHDPYHTKTKYFDARSLKLSAVFAAQWHLSGRYSAERGQIETALRHGEMAGRIHHQWARLHRSQPDTIPDYARHRLAHGRTFNSAGNAAAALALAHDLLRLPRHPNWNAATNVFGSHHAGRRLLLDVLPFNGLWTELNTALHDGRIAELRQNLPRAEHAFARAVAAYFLADDPALARATTALAAIAQRVTAEFRAGKKTVEPPADGHHDGIRQWLNEGGEEYLAVNEWSRCAQALAVLRQHPGDTTAAAEILAGSRRIPPLLRARLLWKIGRRNEARQALLNAASLPLPARIRATAASRANQDAFPFPFSVDPNSADNARRADAMQKLGLSTWEPPRLPTLSLQLLDGTTLENASLQGRHTALIFVYSSTCAHCVDQLNSIREHADLLAAAKLDVRVIAGQPGKELAAWLQTQSAFPATFGADPDEAHFKRVGAYDDFNDMPLHATIYVDPAGRMLWQDVGFEPFTDIEFFVAETRRLRRAYPSAAGD